MKRTLPKILAAILFSAIAIAPLWAQNNAPAENGKNSPVAATASAQVSNAVAVTGTEAQKPSGESSPIRLNNTGINNGSIHISFVPFITFIVFSAILYYFRHRRNKMMHETMLAMIEKGVPITPEMLAQLQSRPSRFPYRPGQCRNRRLLPGMILTGVGIALLITNPGGNLGAGKAGWIVLFMGAAFLIVWLVERNEKNNDQPPKP
jgi:hypothetical protein